MDLQPFGLLAFRSSAYDAITRANGIERSRIMLNAVSRAFLVAAMLLLVCREGVSADPQQPVQNSKQVPLRLSMPVGQLRGALSPPTTPFRYTEATHGAGSLKYVGDVPVFTLVGTPEQMGEQAAILAREVLPPMLETPRRIIQQFGLNY